MANNNRTKKIVVEVYFRFEINVLITMILTYRKYVERYYVFPCVRQSIFAFEPLVSI